MNNFFIDDNDMQTKQAVCPEKPNPIDPFNPFDNPTENLDYNDDYTEIVPQIVLDGCKIPNIPSAAEKKRIKHFYNIAGGGIAFHFLISLLLSNALYLIVTFIIMISKNISLSDFLSGSSGSIINFINTSSIAPAIALITYLTANTAVFFFGTKLAGIKIKSLFRTSELKVQSIIKYIFIAFFLQYAAGIVINLMSLLMQNADVYGNAQSLTTYYSPKYAVISILYSCIVAPVTEELLYRGFVLKSFSKASQRFGIFMSAFFFGISHGNIAQFLFAFTMGVFMAFIDIKHNSVLPSIIVHTSVNILATSSTIIQNYFTADTQVNVIFNFAVLILTVTGLVLFIRFLKSNVFPKSDIRQQFRGKNIALRSSGTIIAALIYAIYIIIQTAA